MKKLNSQQASLAIITLVVFATSLSTLLKKQFFPTVSDPLLDFLADTLVFFVAVSPGALILKRFLSEKPQDRQVFQPFGWKSALYLYALSLLYFYANHYQPGGNLWKLLGLALIVPAVCVPVSRLAYRQTSASKPRQS